MTLVCSKCGYQYHNVILDQQVALNDVAKKMNLHLETKHKDEAKAMQVALGQGIAALMMIGPFTEFLFVPEDEKFVREKMAEARGIVMALLGYDEDDYTEEEEEEEGEDNNENDEEVEVEELVDVAPEPIPIDSVKPKVS